MEKEITLTFRIKGNSPLDLKQKVATLSAISRLPYDKQQLIEELCNNNKALEGLQQNKEMLLKFL